MVEEKEQQRYTKRRRLAWDVPTQQEGQVRQQPVLCRHNSPPKREDDREGHYTYTLGENLTPRYKILSKMGEGTFGRVLECWDRQTREYVAIKVVRSIRKYRDAAMIEVDVLEQLAKNNKGRSLCVQIRNWFDYRNHICIVFEKLGPSLFDFLKRNKYSPFPVDLVWEIGRQLLESVAYMHSLHLIHTDLKPENILLVSSDFIKLPGHKRNSQGEISYRWLPKSSEIKLIDFGSTAYDNQNHSSIVSTRHYRAPEVILGLGWSYPCDMWSVGCILVELCSGEALFQTHENLEHLAMMERVLGPLPEHMIRKASRGAEKYFRRSRLNWPEGAVSRESIRAVRKLDRLKNMISQCVTVGGSRSYFVDLLHGLLKFDPADRLTAQQALDHPFFRNSPA
ncbi:putative dual-specificity kinase CMGC-CLK family [Helianthus annuus]|uniref:dual-specificity kinase n=2 Tax=Helianthus annuus TaxID=4232 RepID=A0A251UAJ9_HELAN|nr:serine/threonine-protein kinase AFC3 isoform X1 [Helianthus annuus]KAF5797760.1 putative dual-specificity kinase CMGC-CLK family [Helianthus annuus]KAJ0549442.1 putative dual-specificity kinase CMGC-CLK family [Helianthus annuus]KAJ0562402.1 putative dual-specificity kinase CMGC-CLK family [Helianthus annuus]KAJ0727777.1 putative dual-specificity kinase CMGC-CLK family [Helianthus annuus]KAJ0903900.1 putative dual-specificity kinase CMGC-CLK family [Helianthus annuus]